MKKLIAISLSVFAIGCGTNKTEQSHFYFEEITVPKSVVRNAWFNHLAEENLALYSAVIQAVIISEKMQKTIYVSRNYENDVIYYRVTAKNEGGSNVLMVNEPKKEILFDHYNASDGKTMRFFAEKYYIEQKTKKLHQDLKLGDFN